MSSYRDHYRLPRENEQAAQLEMSWAHFTEARLSWLYGPKHKSERASQVAADIAAWNALGSSRERAA